MFSQFLGELLDDDIRSIADSITEEHFSVIYGHFHINNNSVEVSQIQRCGDRVITTFTKFFDLWYRTIYDAKTLRRLKRVLQFSAKDKDINKSIIDAWSKILGMLDFELLSTVCDVILSYTCYTVTVLVLYLCRLWSLAR